MVQDDASKTFVFVFPDYVGHLNPALPLARALVQLGHQVHILCRERMRTAIEDTGAIFHSDMECEPELFHSREGHGFGALESLKKEYDIEDDHIILALYKLGNVMCELQLPGVLRFFRMVKPSAVIYCAMCNPEAALAARLLEIPSLAFISFAGPGSFLTLIQQFFSELGLTPEDMERMARSFKPNVEAMQRLKANYGLDVGTSGANIKLKPFGQLNTLADSTALVSTIEELADPMTAEISKAYEAENSKFAYVGPLLDQDGAVRAGHEASGKDSLVEQVRAARKAGRSVVLASMGTVVTSDDATLGWNGRVQGSDGQLEGLTGREMCQAAWAGLFDALGADHGGPLLVVAVGKQEDALDGLQVPHNAVCVPSFPQVDILRMGVDLFVTHGGQNSFTESIANGVPVVVCPAFGDQKVNSRRAVDLGIGQKVDRPHRLAVGDAPAAAAAAAYRSEVAKSVLQVFSESAFRAAAMAYAEKMRQAGGVAGAVEVILAVAAAGKKTQVAGTGNELEKTKVAKAGMQVSHVAAAGA